MIRARFLVDLPAEVWIGEVSRAFPRATLRLLSGVRTGDGATELGEIRAEDPAAVEAELRSHPTVSEYERLELTDDRALGRYETADVSLYDFLVAASLPPEFPIEVRDGRYELGMTGTRAEFDRLRERLAAGDHGHELL